MFNGNAKFVYERYHLTRSPFAQKPTQRDIAELVNESCADLNRMGEPRFKETFLVRRKLVTNGKERNLVYPVSRLRAIHERFKFHFNKIIQPSYLMSPRKFMSQRNNAAVHLDQLQYLTLDLRQFYPSTTRAKIRNELSSQFGMASDVAGLIAHIATADDHACFGSPLTPVLTSLVHRPMFDEIADLCDSEKLEYSVWVDDLTISGQKIRGELIDGIRKIISGYGLKSHKVKMKTGNRPVFITGVGVVGRNLIVKNRLDLTTKGLWNCLHLSITNDEYVAASTQLLSHLGGVRHIVGASSDRGKVIANQMNSVRMKKQKRQIVNLKSFTNLNLRPLTEIEKIERKEEIAAIAF